MDGGTRFVIVVFTFMQFMYGANTAISSDENDDENSLKQALFLVKLLKSDHLDYLREIEANITSEANNTCPDTPKDTSYSSTPMNNLVTRGIVSPTMTPTSDTRMPLMLPASAFPSPALSPAMFPANLDQFMMPGATGLDPPANEARLPFRRAAPPEYMPRLEKNNNYPYTYPRRRMIPDYYYYDFPMRRFGLFRRLDGTTIISNTLSRAKNDLAVPSPEEALSKFSMGPPAASTVKIPSSGTSDRSSIPSTDTTTTSIINTSSTVIHTKKYTQRATKPKGPDKGANMKERTVVTKPPSEDAIVSSQVASELMKEIKGSRLKSFKEKFTIRTPKSTFKLYLPGSSRLPIPLPENNAFCHLYPHSALCGSIFK